MTFGTGGLRLPFMAFRCVLVTPELQVLDESVTHAIIPAEDGWLGILTDRAPLLAKLTLLTVSPFSRLLLVNSVPANVIV